MRMRIMSMYIDYHRWCKVTIKLRKGITVEKKSVNLHQTNYLMKRAYIILLLTMVIGTISLRAAEMPAKRKVYMSYILHGNMNYDRYVRTTLWRDFPVIYDNLLTFMDEHPDFKGQLQFSGQTLGSLQQVAPQVLEHAMRIHKRGQLNFTGTFYSEPVNVNMDGEINYRCALLGTRIVEDFLSEATDGFYLQERAYHPQLPWILNGANVSWTPIITNDNAWRPFRLVGMDGSESVCVPITRSKPIQRAVNAPANSLITIEEDYEIPQKFSRTYKQVAEFNASSTDVEIVWITVKEYIERFGLDEKRYIDHAAKAGSMSNGTYSRWTADPLDIKVQRSTVRAMEDFRAANIFDALLHYAEGWHPDKAIEQSRVVPTDNPMVWNIERADLYPDVESKYLAREGVVTELSRAEHLLLWAVNSDSKGWYPLYEKRVERDNALKNSSLYSQSVIYEGMDDIARRVKLKGFDTYFMALAMEASERRQIRINSERAYDIYDYASGKALGSVCRPTADGYCIEFETQIPSYGYTIFGAKECANIEHSQWREGNVVSTDGIKIEATNDKVILTEGGKRIELSFAPFQLKPLADIDAGERVDYWREAKQYGATRTKVRGSELIVDRQIDWLLHLRQHFVIEGGRVRCEVMLLVPHPTLIRRKGGDAKSFDPRGFDMVINYGKPCKTVFDIPYGITQYDRRGVGHFCLLSMCAMQGAEDGVLVSPRTGEQGFTVDADKGVMTLYLGASTQSGPLKEVVPQFVTPVNVKQEAAWALEPFHGNYTHTILFDTFDGKWQESGALRAMQRSTTPLYIRECYPAKRVSAREAMEPRMSLLRSSSGDVEVTSAEVREGRLRCRINERSGARHEVVLTTPRGGCRFTIGPFGIIEKEF